ncbi:MAG: hypothetical protein K2L25_02270 [Alphaproteobacteria bacterium]|nr:hypothetical protein [Alphaproteobacteria bacterium]
MKIYYKIGMLIGGLVACIWVIWNGISTININTNIGNTIQTNNNYYAGPERPVPQSKIDNIIKQTGLDLSMVPSGYFIPLQRIEPLLIALIKNDLDDIIWMRPDVSVGNSFDAYIKKENPGMHTKRRDCTNLYTPSQRLRIPIMCYPMELAHEFDTFLQMYYIDAKQENYLNKLRNDRRKALKLFYKARNDF